MSTQVAGVLRDPFERPLGNTDIDIRAITNTFAVLPGATVKVTTSAQGEYNFILEPANYAVSVILDGRAVYQGAMTITSTTPPGTLPQLLKQAEMLSELPLNYAEYFQQVQATVKDDADRAQAAADGISDQVDEAKGYAEQSQAYAESSQQSSQTAQQALADTQVIANKFQNLDDAVTQTQQNAQQTQMDAQQTASDKAAAEAAAQRAEDAAGSAETVNERNIRVPTSETINALPAASARANSLASFDASGQSQVTPLSSVALLDQQGKVPLANIPSAAITEVFPVSSQSAMLSLIADPGDVAIVNNSGTPSENGSFILMASPASTLSNWKYLSDNVLVQLAMGSGASKIGYQSSGSGSVMRTVASQLGDYVSVKNYAVGDGVTDDTAGIQQAVNNHSTVYFPPGVYRTTSEIKISGKVCTLFGAGVGVSVIFTDSTTSNGLVFDIGYQQGGGVQNMSISSKSLISDPQSVGSSGVGLYIKNANDNFFCDHFEVIRFGTGIKSRGSYQPRFTNFRICWFSYAGIHLEAYDGTSATDGNGNLFSIGKISNLGYASGTANATGILVEFASGEFFRDIDIQAVGTSLLAKPPAGSKVRYLWMDNILADTAAGDGFVFDGTNAEVNFVFCNGCWSSNNGFNGVTIKGGNTSGIQFRGGTIRSSRNNGVNFLGGKFISFDGVIINNNSNGNPGVYPGVYIGGSLSEFTLNNCIIGNLPDNVANAHQGSGVVLDTGSSNSIKITGCDLRAYYSGTKPIDLRGSISNSVISSNIPNRTADTNISMIASTINLHSYNAISAGSSNYLTAGGLGSLSQAQQVSPAGVVHRVVVTVSATPGVNQNFAYNLVIGGDTISIGTIENGSFILNASVKRPVSLGDNIALQILTSGGAAAATHKASIIITQ